jgi:DNA-binding NarL/FixJ family response regulator
VASPAIAAARVVILTTFERDDYVYEALQAGASGFLLKNASPEDLIHAVRIVADGDALLAPSVTRRVIANGHDHGSTRSWRLNWSGSPIVKRRCCVA